jgi:hypothetical protein
MSLLACGKKEQPIPKPPSRDTVFKATYATDQQPVVRDYYLLDTAWLKDDSLKELSGMVRSSAKDGATLWGEEDSGNKNVLYLMDTSGRKVCEASLQGAFNRDWEDLAGGPGPKTGKYYLYLGDIGDNLFIFPFITIYRFIEPAPVPGNVNITAFDAINLLYPDGPHNAEALMVDPRTKDIYIITKDAQAGLYVARYPQNIHKATKLIKLGVLPISTVTAADISPDGDHILIKNYKSVFYWHRQPDETISDCLQQAPNRLDYHAEPQGESIAWSSSGKGFYTITEKVGSKPPVLFHYKSK